jgi:hypothetical protein
VSRSELRNQQAREALEPLREGERPKAVTIGAIASTVIALIFVVSAVVAVFSDAEVNGSEPSPLPLALFGAAMVAMAVGMLRARYWAVLGFQALLLLILLAASVGLVGATTLLQLAATVLLIIGAGTLFYFMVKALARIQMPTRLPRAPHE